MSKPRVIYWFRTDLRLHDSPALKAALDLDSECLWPIWTWDPHYVYRARVGVNRFQFLIDCQNDVSESLAKINPKQKLHVLREAPQTLFPKLFRQWKPTHLVFEKDTDPYARDRDSKIIALAKKANVEVIVVSGRTLWDSDAIVRKNGNKPTMSITQLEHAGEKIGEVPRPISAPSKLPDPGPTDISGIEQELPENKPDLNEVHRDGNDQSYRVGTAGPQNDFACPTLSELGMPAATTPHRGGETLALQNLSNIIANQKYTATFSKPATAPTDFAPQSTTLLSPHLHFGSLSIRRFYWDVRDVVDKYKGAEKPTKPPTSLIGQLLFRDMYFAAQAALGHVFSTTVGNSHCRFINWHLPTTNQSASQPTDSGTTAVRPYEIDDAQAEEWFQRWKFGKTGFPFIDALMRQLRQEGWMHHLGRHMVACFLTRGGCYVSWERGKEVFEEWLIDHEEACNVGNWQWLSCTAFFAMFYRVYSPVAFGKKWDPEGKLIRRYVPELGAMDKKYIYEPWKAPVLDQKRAGVVLRGEGKNTKGVVDGDVEKDSGSGLMVFPKPMFDFSERRDVCLAGMKEAYAVGLYGDDEKVKSGEWRKLLGPPGDEPGRETGNAIDEQGGEEEDQGGAADDGGDNKGGDKTGSKRKMTSKQGTLDGHVTKRRR